MNKQTNWPLLAVFMVLLTPQLFKSSVYAQKWCKRVPGESNKNRFELELDAGYQKNGEHPITMFNKHDPGWQTKLPQSWYCNLLMSGCIFSLRFFLYSQESNAENPTNENKLRPNTIYTGMHWVNVFKQLQEI